MVMIIGIPLDHTNDEILHSQNLITTEDLKS